MTLGAILMLGGASIADAEDVSSLWNGASVSGFDGVLPSMPENWADLPFQLSVNQSTSYNSNIFNIPAGGGLGGLYGNPVGTLVSQTNVTASTKFHWGSQQFFADGTYGLYRYLNYGNLNGTHNAGDLGWNWVLTSKCSGKLVAAAASTPSVLGQQVGINALNILTTEFFNETATCGITGNWSGILNSGVSRSTNSAALDALNNFTNVFASAGVKYAVTQTNTLQLLATLSHYDYPNQNAALFSLINNPLFLLNPNVPNSGGSGSSVTQQTVNLSYTRQFGPNLSVIASIGETSATLNGSYSGIQPQLSLSATYMVTPKLTLTGSVARVVTPPTGVIAALQTSESANFSANYAMTPKVTLTAGAQIARLTSGLGTTPSQTLSTLFPNLTQSRTYGFNAGVNYAMTPFLSANLNYTFARTAYSNFTTPASIVMLALSYAPH